MDAVRVLRSESWSAATRMAAARLRAIARFRVRRPATRATEDGLHALVVLAAPAEREALETAVDRVWRLRKWGGGAVWKNGPCVTGIAHPGGTDEEEPGAPGPLSRGALVALRKVRALADGSAVLFSFGAGRSA